MAGKTSEVTVQFKRLNTKMLYTHCHGHALNLAVKDACFKEDMLKMTFEMTREICKLVKESPQRNNRIEEIRKTTKNQAKNLHSFCPTRWTVRGQTLDSIINNYEQRMSLWEWPLQKLTNTEMKARIHGAISHMKKFDFFFGCRLGATTFNQTDKLSGALSILSAVEAHDLALKVLAVLRKERSNECFQEVLEKAFIEQKFIRFSGKSCITMQKKNTSTL